jgi:hypothetical protein
MLARLTYANVMATVAVFVALGGSSYAVAAGLVDGRAIKDNTIRSKDLRDNEVRSRDVRDGSLRATDFKLGELPAGKDGAPGRDGAPGATDVVVRTQEPCPTLPSGVHCAFSIQCEAGERATGGGAGFNTFGGNEVLDVSHPVERDGTIPESGDVPTGWAAAIEYSGSGPRNAIGYVICASP